MSNDFYCHHKNHDNSRFCTICGQILKRKQCCCGTSNSFVSMFCSQCGSSLQNLNSSSVSASEKNKKPILSNFSYLQKNNKVNVVNDTKHMINQKDIDDFFNS